MLTPRPHRDTVHPIAWWVWALGIAVATTRAPGAMSTGLLIVALVLVVLLCRDDSTFARSFPAYLVLAGAIVAIRVLFHILIGVKGGGGAVVLPLPVVPLPAWAGGIELLGPVGLVGLGAAASAGLALAALLLCFGAAIALTNPQRTLRSLPASLHLLGTTTVIAMTFAPQLVESWHRVRRAQSLRGRRLRGRHAIAATTLPVLQDALDRSLTIAASMDSRGYARARRGRSGLVIALLLAALVGAALGTYALLDGTSPPWLGLPLLVFGAATAVTGSILAGRRILTTRYRPQAWRARENVIAMSGMAVAGLAIFAPAAAGGVATGVGGWSLTFLFCALVATVPVLTRSALREPTE